MNEAKETETDATTGKRRLKDQEKDQPASKRRKHNSTQKTNARAKNWIVICPIIKCAEYCKSSKISVKTICSNDACKRTIAATHYVWQCSKHSKVTLCNNCASNKNEEFKKFLKGSKSNQPTNKKKTSLDSNDGPWKMPTSNDKNTNKNSNFRRTAMQLRSQTTKNINNNSNSSKSNNSNNSNKISRNISNNTSNSNENSNNNTNKIDSNIVDALMRHEMKKWGTNAIESIHFPVGPSMFYNIVSLKETFELFKQKDLLEAMSSLVIYDEDIVTRSNAIFEMILENGFGNAFEESTIAAKNHVKANDLFVDAMTITAKNDKETQIIKSKLVNHNKHQIRSRKKESYNNALNDFKKEWNKCKAKTIKLVQLFKYFFLEFKTVLQNVLECCCLCLKCHNKSELISAFEECLFQWLEDSDHSKTNKNGQGRKAKRIPIEMKRKLYLEAVGNIGNFCGNQFGTGAKGIDLLEMVKEEEKGNSKEKHVTKNGANREKNEELDDSSSIEATSNDNDNDNENANESESLNDMESENVNENDSESQDIDLMTNENNKDEMQGFVYNASDYDDE